MATKPDDDVDELSKKVQELDMAGSPATTENDDLSSYLTTEGHPFKWNGNRHQLENFLKNLFSHVRYEPEKSGNTVHQFEVKPPKGTIRFYESTKTFQIQGNEQNKGKIKALLKQQKFVPDNKRKDRESGESSQKECNGECNPIYKDEHIKEGEGDEKLLGSLDQFCAAFYHVHRWYIPERRRYRNHDCLDEEKCIIAREAKESLRKAEDIARKAEQFATEAEIFAKETKNESLKSSENAVKAASNAKDFATNARKLAKGWKVQPRTVVAVVKFEKKGGDILYLARYTNCLPQKKHAEDFFKKDVQEQKLGKIINGKNSSEGTITIYLTYQPCNKSTTKKPEGTQGTPPDKSCSETLTNIFTKKLKGRNIKLCVKPSHLYRLAIENPDTNDENDDEDLRAKAKEGIEMLIKAGVNVSEMTPTDWKYLYGITELLNPRQQLDDEIQKILNHINNKL